MCTMTQDWEKRLAAVKAEREKRGLTQVELADAAGVGESTIQNLEGGRTYTRKPAKLDAVWAALQGDAGAPRSPVEPQSVMPLRVQHELNDGDVVDTDVIDLSRGGMKMVVVVTRDREGASDDEAQMREDFAEWTRVQRAIRRIADGREDAAG